ncbi:glycosyl hydrolase family 3 N terminal domain-containing protein [Elsinoe ampelina]|uniref:Probable beta-glucosidase G n=1 Tax=Elsinoe ampelina TaxID=302913 RepID=A0A6A6G320_9PEZI|nr:glycosyl hydrolase family 3 N terminal domain-containing protein [Elsinoe ampelina]
MGPSRASASLCTVLTLTLSLVYAQNSSSSTPAWNQADYATSPPIYPAPIASGAGWEAAYAQADAFVSNLTLEEKAYVVTGVLGPCTGSIKTIPRLGFNGLCLQDGPLAIRQADFASVFPAGLTVAAAWDKGLARLRGQQIGAEFVGKGSHIALGPVAGPLGRSPLGGRNWEGFSPDPFLTGELFGQTILGMEEAGSQACAKHYIGNEQEIQRNPSTVNGNTIQAVSSNIDDRTMHEVYLWPFANAVKVGVSSIMCAYQRVNGSYSCQNSKILNGLLKEELGFQGYVVSDWGGTRSGVPAIQAGLDMDMPGALSFTDLSGASYFGGNISAAVNNGSLSIERVDDMVRRVMTPYFRLKQNDASFPLVDPAVIPLNLFTQLAGGRGSNYTWPLNNQSSVDVRANHAAAIRELGAGGIVLLKNENNTLPLQRPRNIAVFGNDAGDLTEGLYANPLSGSNEFGYEFGVLGSGGGSGTGRYTYVISPLEAVKARSLQHGTIVQYVQNNTLVINSGSATLTAGTPPDVCIAFVKTYASEGDDRTSLLVDWNGTALVDRVASFCPNTVVVTHSAGLNYLPFASNPNVTAILTAHLGGQEVGNSLVDVLYGDTNPSGHLPYTIPLAESDYSFVPITNSSELLNTTNATAWQSDFTEGPLIDYRHFDFYNLSVAYPFGFGLSYTTFELSNVSIARTTSGPLSAEPPTAATVPGGNPTLWDVLYRVSVTVANTGERQGQAVPQLYLSLPAQGGVTNQPVRVLRGFEKVGIAAGESTTVGFDVMRRDLSSWDVVRQEWIIGEGEVGVRVGLDSRDAAQETTFTPLQG